MNSNMDSSAAASWNIDQPIIPGAFSKFIQVPHVSWNKPFQNIVYSSELLAEERIHNETIKGNRTTLSPKQILEWILESYLLNLLNNHLSFARWIQTSMALKTFFIALKNHSSVR